MFNNADSKIVSKTFKNYDTKIFIEKLTQKLREAGFETLDQKVMTQKDFPKIISLTFKKGNQILRAGIVHDRNGITVTIPLFKDTESKKIIAQILDSL